MADSMPAPSTTPAKLQKRPAQAAFGPEDDLPHPRRLCFKRRLQLDIEERFREMIIAAIPQVKLDAPSGSSPLGMAIVLGRVVGDETAGPARDVILPTATEVILDQGHRFLPDLTPGLFRGLRMQFDRRLNEHKAQTAEERRWAQVSLQQRQMTSWSSKAVGTFYTPASRWHYQLRFRFDDFEGPPVEAERRETNLVFQKVPSSEDPMWTVSLVQEAGKAWLELRMNEVFLLSHRSRLCSAKTHCFNRLCRDFRRNAQAVQQLIDRMEGLEGDGVRLYYPGIFDPALDVQEYYDQRAKQPVDESTKKETARIRSFNNCVKTMMLESFMDGMKGELKILDLGCGRGQDIHKYSREHRQCCVQLVVGIDFASAAIEEAKRRYNILYQKAQNAGRPEFLATFQWNDLRRPETLQALREAYPDGFDVVVCQLALHYILSSEEAAKRFLQILVQLLRPGGRFIATVPSCEVLADFYEKASFMANSTCERTLEQKFFQVKFQGLPWQQLQAAGVTLELDEVFLKRWGLPYHFILEGAVSGEEFILPWEAFEEMAGSVGLRVLADASFPDLFDQLKDRSKFYHNTFSKDMKPLDTEEETLFKLYQGFVMERTRASAQRLQ
ncbi:unnamed protein product, partial [Cladocopium goreaui]